MTADSVQWNIEIFSQALKEEGTNSRQYSISIKFKIKLLVLLNLISFLKKNICIESETGQREVILKIDE